MNRDPIFTSSVSPRRPYVRPMKGWWFKQAVYRLYMLRELTAVAVAVYAIGLLAGVVALSCGPQAYTMWLQVMAHPFVIGVHAIVFMLLVFHAWSWFDIMPKTMPPIRIGSWQVPAACITRSGQMAVLLVSVCVAVWVKA